MKYLSIFLSISLFFSLLQAQSDVFETSEGDLTLYPILHSTTVLTWNGKTIYYDPYGGAEKFEAFSPPDLVLISDIHGDHLNIKTLEALDLKNATLVAPQAVIDKLGAVSFAEIISLGNGGTTRWEGLEITGIAMYNLPESDDSRHTKGRGNGYLLTIDEFRLYFSGDTEDIKEMRALEDIDVALVCMNMPYTMTVDQAADAVLEFQPKVVYPFHYRGKEGFADVEEFKQLVEKGNPEIEVRLRDWYGE